MLFNPQVGSTKYDLLRVPSWCDRILFKGDSLSCKRYESYQLITIADHFPVFAEFLLSSISNKTLHSWNIVFHPVSGWIDAIPFSCNFIFLNDFWKVNGSYRDWIGVYSAEFENYFEPIHWIYVVTCDSIDNEKMALAEFPMLTAGKYRLAYFSIKKNSIQGLSDPFEIINVNKK